MLLGEGFKVCAFFEFGDDVVGKLELGLRGDQRILGIDFGDVDFVELEGVPGDVAQFAAVFAVFRGDFVGQRGDGVFELPGAHGLDDEFFFCFAAVLPGGGIC